MTKRNKKSVAHHFKVIASSMLALGWASLAEPAIAQVTSYDVDIEAQALSSALQALAQQLDMRVLFAPDAVADLTAPQIVGSMTAWEAFDRLLEPTDLTYELSDTNVVMVRTQAQADRAGDSNSATNSTAPAARSERFQEMSGSREVGRDRIIVTARKRDEDLMDVPLSMVAISGEELRQMGVDRLKDLEGQVSNFHFTGPDSFLQPSITVRGISSSARNIGFDSGIGIYVDDVYQGRPIAFDQPLFDIEQIEFLRGPQGTIFGRNTIAGAINVVTRKPGDEFEVRGDLEVGNFNLFRQRVSIEGPVVEDTVFASLSVQHVTRDAYVENIFVGREDLGNLDRTAARMQVRVTPNSAVEMLFGLDAERAEEVPYFQELIEGVGTVPGPHTTNQNAIHASSRDMFGGHANFTYSSGNGFVWTSISAYRDVEIFGRLDQDVTPLDVLNSEFTDRQKFFTQEFRITSPASDRFNYVLGAFYMSEELSTDRVIIPGDLLGIPDHAVTIGSIDSTSLAAFFNATLDVTDQFSIDFGVRVTQEQKDLGLEHDFAPFGAVIPFFRDEYDDTNTSPTISFNYHPIENILAYLTVSSGYKSGGFNADFTPDPTQIRFAAEQVVNYEIGLKGDFFDQRLSASLAAFFMDYSDLQVEQFIDFTSGFVIRNAASAEIRGFELDFRAMPVENFVLAGGVGYVDPVYKDFKNGGGPGVDYDGNRLSGASDWTGHGSATYSFPMFGSGTGLIRADMTYRGAYFQRDSNDEQATIGEVTLVNARAEFSPRSDAWSVALWADNLFDETYAVQKFDLDFIAIGHQDTTVFGPPRMYGVTLTVRR